MEPSARGGENPMIALQSVVLPMPFRPTIATGSWPIVKVTSSSAWALRSTRSVPEISSSALVAAVWMEWRLPQSCP